MRTFTVCFVFVLLSTYASAEIYRWVDKNGHAKFSDKSQHARDAYYVPKTVLSSYDGGRSSKALGKKSINQTKENYAVTRKRTEKLNRTENLEAETERSTSENVSRREQPFRSSLKGTKAIGKTQALHDKQTNYDGYGSELSRYQNAIIMKTHNSVIKGGNMEYWNGLDDYYYKGRNRGKAIRHRW